MRASIASLLGATVLLWTAPALADDPREQRFEMTKTLVFGVAEHELSSGGEVTGWRLNRSWYLGHEDADDGDSLALIWDGRRDQVSISTEGIRFTRRF